MEMPERDPQMSSPDEDAKYDFQEGMRYKYIVLDGRDSAGGLAELTLEVWDTEFDGARFKISSLGGAGTIASGRAATMHEAGVQLFDALVAKGYTVVAPAPSDRKWRKEPIDKGGDSAGEGMVFRA